MTPKELRRLRRSDLMEMLLQLSRENLQLRQDLEDARQQLQEKHIKIEEAGSLAEAALRLNGIFEAAQAACEQYEENIRRRCRDLEEQTRQACGLTQHDAGEEMP